jgi:hypothetical protein
MSKRLVSGPLWFVAVWGLVEFIEYFTGLPRVLGPLFGVVAAAFVMLDPFGLFWPRSEPRTLEPNTQDVVGASPVR